MVNSVLLKELQLRENEKVRSVIRRSTWFYGWPITVAMVLIILPFFLIYPLFLRGSWGVLVFCLLLIAGLWLLIRTFISYYFTSFIMTSSRIIDVDQKGFFNRAISGALYDKIGDIVCKQKGITRAILRVGDIYIGLNDKEEATLKLSAIKHPQRVVAEILAHQSRYQNRIKPKGMADYILNKIKIKIGEEAYHKLIAD